jgi:hypothetical protein
MQLQLNTDHHLRGSPRLAERLEPEVARALDRFVPRVTRVEMHLNDLDGGDKGGPDKRCRLEARIAGRTPVSVSHVAPAWDPAIGGALDKLATALDRAFGKRDASQRAAPRPARDAGDEVG